MEIATGYLPLFQQLGLATLADVFALTGETVRKIDSRETKRVVLGNRVGHFERPLAGARATGNTLVSKQTIIETPTAHLQQDLTDSGAPLNNASPVPNEGNPVVVYVKYHGKPTWRERIIPWLRGSRPIVGASGEWTALQRFHQIGIPTMEPVAFDDDGQRSFVMTRELQSECDLKTWVENRAQRDFKSAESCAQPVANIRLLVSTLAGMVRTMHGAGLHHQDLYLNHVLWCGSDTNARPDLRIIDLGRVRQQIPLARRWILKDLAQLNYSAQLLPCATRLRFLRQYLGRPFCRADRWLVAAIIKKSSRIDRHTRKHQL